jgi:hypothetical protein
MSKKEKLLLVKDILDAQFEYFLFALFSSGIESIGKFIKCRFYAKCIFHKTDRYH